MASGSAPERVSVIRNNLSNVSTVMTYLPTLIISLVMLTAFWPLSLALKDVSIVDIAWGPTLAVLGWVAFSLGGNVELATLIPLVLVSLWGARLGIHLLGRRLESGKEDHRYTAIRKKAGRFFPLFSLVTVFWLQGVLVWLISWPLQAALTAKTGSIALAALGWVLTLAGIVIEGIADWQLTAFRREGDHRDRVLDVGLWRYSRHPNYFGDLLTWWGFFLAGLAAGAPWWTIVSPAVMSALLIHFSGMNLMEETIAARRPAYRAYVERTSAFLPWLPRKH